MWNKQRSGNKQLPIAHEDVYQNANSSVETLVTVHWASEGTNSLSPRPWVLGNGFMY